MKLKSGIGIILVTVVLSILFLWRCAHQGSLSGGPKDVVAPMLLEADPPQRTLEFNAEKITLTFNEFIQLKDQSKEIFISPPMQVKPEYKVQGKSLVIEFREELKPNSTYTINFGNAITDFTEGNAMTNFEYVFSTGSTIDSLFIDGQVLNAFDLKPEQNIIAMVFTDNNDTIPLDSLPLRVPPRSASKTGKDGKFAINNLGPGSYLLFALEDQNNNFYFDLPNERIGFLDSLIVPDHPVVDTGFVEEADSSEFLEPVLQRTPENIYSIYLFKEIDSTQKLLGKKLIGDNRLQYIFRMPADSFHVSLVNTVPPRPDWYIPEISRNRDTIDLWLMPGLPDTIYVRIAEGDSLSDTTRFYLSQILRTIRQKKIEDDYLTFTTTTRAGALDLNKQLIFFFPEPVMTIDTSKILLKTESDSISPSVAFIDTIQRKAIVNYKFKAGETCKVIVDDSAFTDLSGRVNDSTIVGFRVRNMEDYGILLINTNIPPGDGQYIIQLLDTKEKVLSEQVIDKSTIVKFGYLMPGKYKLKAVHDMNRNGMWDPGRYEIKLLPEKVLYYPEEIEIRANWDLQEDWDLANE